MRLRFLFGLALLLALCLTAQAAEPHWLRLDSSHFFVLTNADEQKGHDIAVRFEQMRDVFSQLLMRSRVNLSIPIDIIALKTDDDFSKLCPTAADSGIARGGFSLIGRDRAFFVLNLSRPESWQAVSYDFARLLLSYNYPPTQRWFDEGFAEYFASLQIENAQAKLGGDPEAAASNSQKSPGLSASSSFIDLLRGTTWNSLPDLFNTRIDVQYPRESGRHTLFFAQSWIVMHYLITQNKLPEIGTYLGLVANDNSSAGDAIQKAFGETSAQLNEQIKQHFQSLPGVGNTAAGANTSAIQSLVTTLPETVSVTRHEVLPFYAEASLAEMSLRVPEHREQARQQLESLVADKRTESAIAHHALGWDHMDRKDFDQARDEMSKALELDPKDGWAHYYQARMKYDEAVNQGQEVKGLANMMEDLHIVLDWKPEFGEAYDMLAWAQREGGGVHAATDSIQAALKLDPRNQNNRLELARIYLAGKNWDAATALLNALTSNSDSQIASAAKAYLHDLPMLMKYGVAPQPEKHPAAPAVATSTTHAPGSAANAAGSPSESDSDNNSDEPAEPKIDRRPILYLKAKLIAVDCSTPPAATLTVTSGAKTLKLHIPDYKSMALVGADQFSCDWKDQTVAVNYKASGAGSGDLVSLELR